LDIFSYTVDYTSYDADGKVDSFSVRLDGGAWSAWTEKAQATGFIKIASDAETHTFEVKAKDNEGTEDPSPAKATLSLAQLAVNKPPTTAITSGPPNGATSSRGVKFEISGTDEDGKVATFVYSLDGGSEQSLVADANGKGIIEFSSALGNLLPPGNHSLAVTGVDNLGSRDPTPATNSFFVGTGFKPVLALTTTVGPPSSGGWFNGVNVPLAWSVSMAHYFGILDHFEYSLDDPANFTSTKTASVSLAGQTAGSHTFRVRAIDTGENVSDILAVNFTILQLRRPADLVHRQRRSNKHITYTSEPDMVENLKRLFKFYASRCDVNPTPVPIARNIFELTSIADLAKYSASIMTVGAYGSSSVSNLIYCRLIFRLAAISATNFRTVNFRRALKDAMPPRRC
jgi:hypothetical protein